MVRFRPHQRSGSTEATARLENRHQHAFPPYPPRDHCRQANDGNIIVDRTHHMRTIQTRQNGNNDLFELRGIFGGQDSMFVEFISEACQQCSFAVRSPGAFLKLNSVILKINHWAADQVEGQVEAPSAICIVPHFRIDIPCAKSDGSFDLGIGDGKLFSPWRRALETMEYDFSVDVILQEQWPNLLWACMVLRGTKKNQF